LNGKIEKVVILGEIFKIQTQTKDGWLDLTQPKQHKIDHH